MKKKLNWLFFKFNYQSKEYQDRNKRDNISLQMIRMKMNNELIENNLDQDINKTNVELKTQKV